MFISEKPIEILLIEDNEGDIILTKKAFKKGKINNNLAICRDGKEGIDYLFKRGKYEGVPTPDLILLDLNMPEMNGQEVLEVLKNDEDLCVIPVIILTTSSSDEDILKSYKLQASGYIKKPVDFRQFGEVIGQLQNYWFTIMKFPPKL